MTSLGEVSPVSQISTQVPAENYMMSAWFSRAFLTIAIKAQNYTNQNDTNKITNTNKKYLVPMYLSWDLATLYLYVWPLLYQLGYDCLDQF